jgi:hypothetical protein
MFNYVSTRSLRHYLLLLLLLVHPRRSFVLSFIQTNNQWREYYHEILVLLHSLMFSIQIIVRLVVRQSRVKNRSIESIRIRFEVKWLTVCYCWLAVRWLNLLFIFSYTYHFQWMHRCKTRKRRTRKKSSSWISRSSLIDNSYEKKYLSSVVAFFIRTYSLDSIFNVLSLVVIKYVFNYILSNDWPFTHVYSSSFNQWKLPVEWQIEHLWWDIGIWRGLHCFLFIVTNNLTIELF